MSSSPRIVVLGTTGMLGHKMFQRLTQDFTDVFGISRDLVTSERFRNVGMLRDPRILQGVDALDWDALEKLLRRLTPDHIVNCIGIIKQRGEAHAAIPSLQINALLPHRLADAAAKWSGRVTHFSTDCVFSGRKGNYSETDLSDAQDLYGRSKYLGEVATENALTIRTSIIGRELAEFRGLLEWLLSQNGKAVQGYRKAIFSGVTTNYLADLTARLLKHYPSLHGLYQVASPPIPKFDLLSLISQLFQLDIEVRPVDGEICDRSMRADRFEGETGYRCPSWPELIQQLYEDATPYEAWRMESNERTLQAL